MINLAYDTCLGSMGHGCVTYYQFMDLFQYPLRMPVYVLDTDAILLTLIRSVDDARADFINKRVYLVGQTSDAAQWMSLDGRGAPTSIVLGDPPGVTQTLTLHATVRLVKPTERERKQYSSLPNYIVKHNR